MKQSYIFQESAYGWFHSILFVHGDLMCGMNFNIVKQSEIAVAACTSKHAFISPAVRCQLCLLVENVSPSTLSRLLLLDRRGSDG